MEKQKLDLDSLLKQGKKVYVRNNALQSNMLLILEFRDSNGRSRPFKIPPTELPFCLSDDFSAELIKGCTDLRNHLKKRTVVLLSETEAEAMLNTPEALEEMQSLTISYYSDDAPPNAIRDALSKVKNRASHEPVVTTTAQLKTQSQEDPITPRVRGLIVSYQSKEKSAKDTLVSLRRMKSVLTEAELTHVITECKDDGSIREFAEVALAERSAVPPQPFKD